jgi:hypothetical protein
MDEALAKRQWKRAQLDDLKGESAKLAARVICRAVRITPGAPTLMAVIDVHLWLQDDVVRMDLVSPEVPPFLQALALQGSLGVTPHAVGLVPCSHKPWHWNPFCLPLVWQQEMNSTPHFDVFTRRYARVLQDSTWQCPDAARLMQ